MRRLGLVSVIAISLLTCVALAQQASTTGPYKVLKTAKVGGEGGWDYIYADVAGRRLYIPRRGSTGCARHGHAGPRAPPFPTRLTIFNLDTLEPVGEIDGVGGNGAAVDPKSGHGFTSSKPVSMFDTKTMKLIKTIDVGAAARRTASTSTRSTSASTSSVIPTKDATVIDAKDGTVLGTIDLGGVPEQGVADGKGMLYVVMQDAQGSVTVVDVKTMKATAHYPFGDKGGCNGLALDVKNQRALRGVRPLGQSAGEPPQPMMVILSAKDGKILANLPLAGGSDGAVFNPATMEAFSTHGNGTMTVVKEKQPDEFRGRAESSDDERRAHDDARQQDGPPLHDERRSTDRRRRHAASAGRPRARARSGRFRARSRF